VKQGHWKKRENRRKRLCEFAAKMGFDPLVADNWEKIHWKTLETAVLGMKTHFNGSYKLTLADAFPELQFSSEWLSSIKQG